MSSLGSVIYNPSLDERKINLNEIKDLKQLCVIKKFFLLDILFKY